LIIGTDKLSSILEAVHAKTNINTEISVELNPDHIEDNEPLLDLGFNRLSIGVQTTNTNMLGKIKRAYNMKKLVQNIRKIRKASKDLSLDFMFGLPGQGLKDLKDDIRFVKDQMPDHLSFYLFTPPSNYEHMKECASDTLAEQMLYTIHDSLLKLGYDHYEVSNYAFNNKICRHNMAYWERKSYLGIGAGSHSFISEKKQRMWHVRDVLGYIKDQAHHDGTETLDDKMEQNEKIMLGLRLLNVGVKKQLLMNKDLSPFIKKGLITIKRDSIVVTREGVPLLDYITSELAT
jgi:oxygen-independent coproporphyrinogen-3 oxidase